jgi:methyl-accepting chemotaxis protein
LRKKFLLIGLVALTMAAPPAGLLAHDTWLVWQATRDEVAGLAPAHDLLTLIQLTQKHRGLSSSVLDGDGEGAGARSELQAEVLRATDKARDSSSPYAAARQMAERLSADWRSLGKEVSTAQVSPAASFERHTSLIGQELAWLAEIVDGSTLALDPEAASYYLMLAALEKQPKVSEWLGQARARGSLALTKHQLSVEDRLRLGSAVAQAQGVFAESVRMLQRAREANPAVAAVVVPHLEAAQAALAPMLLLVERELMGSTELRYSSSEYFKTASAAIDAQFNLSHAAFDELGRLLDLRARRSFQSLLLTLMAMLAVGGVGCWLMVALARGIERSVQEAGAAAAALARGDLSHRLQVQSGDEIGQMARAVGDAMLHLKALIGDVRGRVDAVALASQEIAAGNHDLSSRTETQASSLEQTASAIAEMTASVGQTAQHAQRARQLADEARTDAHQGQSRFGEVARTMDNIGESSRRIGEITAVIDGIAFQTNLLALNAAVEAARAGEHGRGFAVVASDVRALAARSAQAATQIRQLIDESAARVALGSRQSAESAQSMTQVVSHIDKMAQLVEQIATAAAEQSRGIGEVNTAVADIEQSTQQNAALVEQTAAAALSLSNQADRMVASIAVFRTAEPAP